MCMRCRLAVYSPGKEILRLLISLVNVLSLLWSYNFYGVDKREYGYYRNKSPYSKRACSAQRKYIAQRTVIKRHNQRILQRKYGYKCVYKIYISQDLYAQMIRFARFYKIYCRRNDFIHCISSYHNCVYFGIINVFLLQYHHCNRRDQRKVDCKQKYTLYEKQFFSTVFYLPVVISRLIEFWFG